MQTVELSGSILNWFTESGTTANVMRQFQSELRNLLMSNLSSKSEYASLDKQHWFLNFSDNLAANFQLEKLKVNF